MHVLLLIWAVFENHYKCLIWILYILYFFEFRAKMDKTDDYMERELKYSHFCKMRLFLIIFYTLLWDEIIVKSRIAWEFV